MSDSVTVHNTQSVELDYVTMPVDKDKYLDVYVPLPEGEYKDSVTWNHRIFGTISVKKCDEGIKVEFLNLVDHTVPSFIKILCKETGKWKDQK